MISKKFCIIGVDNDFTDFIMRNYSFFTGYFSKSNRYYKFSKKKKLGDHNLYNWKKLKKKYDPNVIITIVVFQKNDETRGVVKIRSI